MPLHLSRSTISIAYSGGKIVFESAKEWDRGENPVQIKRIVNTDGKGGFIQYKVGMNESREASLIVQNVPKERMKILKNLHETEESFTLTLVDTKDATTVTLVGCVLKIDPEQQIVGVDDNFDIKLTMIYVASKES